MMATEPPLTTGRRSDEAAAASGSESEIMVREQSADSESRAHDYANNRQRSASATLVQEQAANQATIEAASQQEASGGGLGKREPTGDSILRLPERSSASESGEKESADSTALRDPQTKLPGSSSSSNTQVKHVRLACCCASGESCSKRAAGTRPRANLLTLIEKFDQVAATGDPSVTRKSPREISPTSHYCRHRLKPIIARSRGSGEERELGNKQQMRAIITPVKYEPSDKDEEEEDDDEEQEEEETDSLEYIRSGDIIVRNSAHGDVKSTSQLDRVVTKRESFPTSLAKSQLNKLTATNWQPPTDWRKYETLRLKSSRSKSCSSRNQTRAAHSSASNQDECDESLSSKEEEEVEDCGGLSTALASRGPTIVRHQPSNSRRLLSQLARLRRLSEPAYRVKRPEKVAQVESLIEQLERATANWDEDELLLDRARRRDWPQEYHTKRSLDEQKQTSTTSHHQSRVELYSTGVSSATPEHRRAHVHPLEEDTIARSHSVLVAYATSEATKQRPPPQTSATTPRSATSNRSSLMMRGQETYQRSQSLGRKPRKPPRSSLADRYHDDLAVRRLGGTRRSPSTSQLSSQTSIPQMSYLLCSSAYTPSIEPCPRPEKHSPRLDWWLTDSIERRLRLDDLHYRAIKTRPEPHEPPFGIPRQTATAASHSSTSHYLRRDIQLAGDDPSAATLRGSVRGCNCAVLRGSTCASSDARRRPDSKVSFVDESMASGFVSADSGVAAGAGSPLSATASPQPAGLRFAASPAAEQRQQRQFYNTEQYDAVSPTTGGDTCHLRPCNGEVEEVYLDYDLEAAGKWPTDDADCGSPIPEHYFRVHYANTPPRRRPKINLESPRAKSPLVKVSPYPKSRSPIREIHRAQEVAQVRSFTEAQALRQRATGELECRYEFGDDDDERERNSGGENITETQQVSSKCNSANARGTNENTHKSRDRTERTSSIIKDTKAKEQTPFFTIGQYETLNKPLLKIL